MKSNLLKGLAGVLSCLMLFGGCASKDTTPTDTAETSVSAQIQEATDAPVSQEVASESGVATESENAPVTMTLAAAASLEDSFKNELIPMFTKQYPWITVEGTYDSSGKLQTQIEEGLDASVFISAATKQMDALVEEGLVEAMSVVGLLENEIVLIAPVQSETTIDSFDKIGEAEHIALGDPASVPVGQYSEEALTKLNVWETIQDKVSLATNVTEVLNQVAEGSADVGIVYATDAAQMPDKVKVIARLPEGVLETKVIYPVGVLTNAPQKEAGELFVNFLQTPQAIAIFEKNGFKSNQ